MDEIVPSLDPTDGIPDKPDPEWTRKLIRCVAILGVAVLVAVVGYLLILVQSQQEVLGRRTPTLDYLVCHDARSDGLKISQSEWLLAPSTLINLQTATAEPDPKRVADAFLVFNEATVNLDASNQRLRDATDESLPLQAGAGDDGRFRCPTAPVAN